MRGLRCGRSRAEFYVTGPVKAIPSTQLLHAWNVEVVDDVTHRAPMNPVTAPAEGTVGARQEIAGNAVKHQQGRAARGGHQIHVAPVVARMLAEFPGAANGTQREAVRAGVGLDRPAAFGRV